MRETSSARPAGGWPDADDALLAVRAATEREVFGELYDRWFDRIYGYCYRRLQAHAAAEDATSQTFLKAFAGIASYRPDAMTFRAWLFTIAHNVVIDVYRRNRSSLAIDDQPDLPATGQGPEEHAMAMETDAEVEELLRRLPDDQAHLIRLRMAGLTDREIADVLDRSYSAVRSAQYRALLRMRELIGDRAGSTRRTSR